MVDQNELEKNELESSLAWQAFNLLELCVYQFDIDEREMCDLTMLEIYKKIKEQNYFTFMGKTEKLNFHKSWNYAVNQLNLAIKAYEDCLKTNQKTTSIKYNTIEFLDELPHQNNSPANKDLIEVNNCEICTDNNDSQDLNKTKTKEK